jgi:hypothetical protein
LNFIWTISKFRNPEKLMEFHLYSLVEWQKEYNKLFILLINQLISYKWNAKSANSAITCLQLQCRQFCNVNLVVACAASYPFWLNHSLVHVHWHLFIHLTPDQSNSSKLAFLIYLISCVARIWATKTKVVDHKNEQKLQCGK